MDIQKLLNSDVDIDTTTQTTIRELEPGDYFMPIRLLRRYGVNRMSWTVRKRTDNPFRSETVLGTTINTYPSDRVHPVRLVVNPTTN